MTTDDKLAAYRSYDFDGDKKWQAYLGSVEITVADREAAISKLKAKWYKKNIEPDFDIAAALEQSKPAATNTGSESSRPNIRPEPSSYSAPPPQASSARPAAAAAPSSSSQKQMIIMYAGLLLSTVLYIQPIHSRLSHLGWSTFIKLAMLIQGIKVYSAHGLPRFSLASLKDYAGRALMTTDFQYLILALVFINGPANYMLMLPYCVLATYHVFAYLSDNHSSHPLWKARGEKTWAWLRQRQRDALVLNAMAEIGLACTSLMLMFTSLSFLPKAYMTWQLLKLRYWTPDAQLYQRQAWAKLDQRTAGIRARVPVLNKAVGWGQRWFESVPGRQ